MAGRRRAGRPQGTGADRLLPPAHRRAGHDGRRHLGGGQVRAPPRRPRVLLRRRPPSSTSWSTSPTGSTGVRARRRGADRQRRVPGAAARAAGVDGRARTRCRRGRWSSASAAASTSPPSACAVQKKDAAALAGEFGLTLQPSVPGALDRRHRRALSPAAARRRGSWPPRAPAPTCFFLSTLERGAGLRRDRATSSPTARLRRRGRRRLHPAAAPGRDASRRVQPALRRLGRGDAGRTCSDLSDDLAANLIAAGAYFSRPYGSWAQPVYNRDAAARDALRKVKAIFDPAGDHEPRQALLRRARRASALAAKEA